LVDKLLENPLILLAAAALIALLAGLGIYKARQRRNIADVDSAFLESRLQPDSFFGASGGQRVDTNDGAATGSSMVYSPSQLDAADDVDPVAEADVYLAYGRDLQAEEILKEALRTHSGRIAVHQKLLDIYAKRRDVKAFEGMANEAFKLTGELGPEWARICELGLGIDPTNPLYQPGGQPSLQNQTVALPANDVQNFAATSAATQKLIVPVVASSSAPAPVDLDLDLDFSLDEEPASAIVEAQPSQLERTVAISPVAAGPAPLDMDFGLTTEAMATPADAPKAMPVELDLPDLSMANDTVAIHPGDSEDFRQQAEVSFGSTSPIPLQSNHSAQSPLATVDEPLPDVSFGYTAPGELTASQAPLNALPASDSGMLEFDLGTLSLDLDPVEEEAATGALAEPEDPLATKLALAEEFVSIGDDDGARALIEEVIAEASGDLKLRAQRALSSLG
jgi:pilus assembly protein FimV